MEHTIRIDRKRPRRDVYFHFFSSTQKTIDKESERARKSESFGCECCHNIFIFEFVGISHSICQTVKCAVLHELLLFLLLK